MGRYHFFFRFEFERMRFVVFFVLALALIAAGRRARFTANDDAAHRCTTQACDFNGAGGPFNNWNPPPTQPPLSLPDNDSSYNRQNLDSGNVGKFNNNGVGRPSHNANADTSLNLRPHYYILVAPFTAQVGDFVAVGLTSAGYGVSAVAWEVSRMRGRPSGFTGSLKITAWTAGVRRPGTTSVPYISTVKWGYKGSASGCGGSSYSYFTASCSSSERSQSCSLNNCRMMCNDGTSQHSLYAKDVCTGFRGEIHFGGVKLIGLGSGYRTSTSGWQTEYDKIEMNAYSSWGCYRDELDREEQLGSESSEWASIHDDLDDMEIRAMSPEEHERYGYTERWGETNGGTEDPRFGGQVGAK